MPVRPSKPKAAARQRSMLSVVQCRDILGASAPTVDAEVEQLRDALYMVAQVWIDGGAKSFRSPFAESVTGLSEDEWVDIEERVAVMEVDGGLTRAEAEQAVLAAFTRQREKGVH